MYKLFLMWRYLTRRALSLVAVVALTLSVGALVVAPSIMSGFQEEFYKRIRGTLSDMTMASGTPHAIPEDPLIELRLEKLPHVQAIAPYVENPALDKHLEQVDYCFVRGVDPEREAKVSKFAEYLMSPREILEEVAKQRGAAREILDVLEGRDPDADPELRAAYEEFYPAEPDLEQIYASSSTGCLGTTPTSASWRVLPALLAGRRGRPGDPHHRQHPGRDLRGALVQGSWARSAPASARRTAAWW
ncbi:MAG: hypothetical protein R3F62_05870 [Planctomycetota bacterium]